LSDFTYKIVASNQNSSKSSHNHHNIADIKKFEMKINEDNLIFQQLKRTEKALAQCQKKNNRLESELDQNRSLMAKILACQITAKNKTRENKNILRNKSYNSFDERCVGIKVY
jgi:hypothetical protein